MRHLEALGYTVVRFRNEEVFTRIECVLKTILHHLHLSTPPLAKGRGRGRGRSLQNPQRQRSLATCACGARSLALRAIEPAAERLRNHAPRRQPWCSSTRRTFRTPWQR